MTNDTGAARRLGFVLEYSLGHATHAENLKLALKDRPDIRPAYVDLPYHGTPGAWARLPGFRSNWSLRASMGAYLALRPQAKSLQALLFHTQVTSLFSVGLMRRVPAVISLDATPVQYDAMGRFYGHLSGGNPRIEAIKKRLNLRALTAATHLVAWSEWTRVSLITDYGMPAEKITVIPPGIDTQRWQFPRKAEWKPGPLHLLFVGGDFKRKGGDVLLEAFHGLLPGLNAHLHLVTNAPEAGADTANLHIYRDIKPNSEPLLKLFRNADIFVFPTRADCLPLAVMEALAAGLPVITTRVGALPEAVTHGETGLVVPPGEARAVAEAITALAQDPVQRTLLGRAAREKAAERYDAVTNYRQLVDVVAEVAL